MYYRTGSCKNGGMVPTQRFYHIPSDWLQKTDNLIVLFEEGGDGGLNGRSRDVDAVSIVAFVDHLPL